MRKRLARALATRLGVGDFDDMPERGRANFYADADTVLGELREPTPGMVEAGGITDNGETGFLGAKVARECWQEMVDSARKG